MSLPNNTQKQSVENDQNNNDWEKILFDQDEEIKKNDEKLSEKSDQSLKIKKKNNLRLDIGNHKNDSELNIKPKINKKVDSKTDFIKDDKLKERLNKFTKSILDKDSSIDSHSVSKNGNMKNDVDWKAKRRDFLEKLQTKKNEEEMMKQKMMSNNEFHPSEIPKKPKSRKCVIF